VTRAPAYILDANILIRFLREDHAAHSPASKKLFEKAKTGKAVLHLPFITIAETFHVLRSFYKVERTVAATEMVKIMNAPNVLISAPFWIHDAVNEYLARNVSFGDACIAAEARASSFVVASFDTDFDGFAGIERFEPK
jgi:predicted nucleic acid-binding protein